jgi:hypothetical protein
MSDLGFLGWAFVVVGGMVVLGAILFYARQRTKAVTPREEAITEAATEQLYREQERDIRN